MKSWVLATVALLAIGGCSTPSFTSKISGQVFLVLDGGAKPGIYTEAEARELRLAPRATSSVSNVTVKIGVRVPTNQPAIAWKGAPPAEKSVFFDVHETTVSSPVNPDGVFVNIVKMKSDVFDSVEGVRVSASAPGCEPLERLFERTGSVFEERLLFLLAATPAKPK